MFFVDSAHFVLGTYLGYLWCLTRMVIRAPSGRQRFNVPGALNVLFTSTDKMLKYLTAGQADKSVEMRLKLYLRPSP